MAKRIDIEKTAWINIGHFLFLISSYETISRIQTVQEVQILNKYYND